MEKLELISHIQGVILGIHESAYDDIMTCIDEDRLIDMIIIVDLRHHSYLYEQSNDQSIELGDSNSHHSSHVDIIKYMGIPILDPITTFQCRDNSRANNFGKTFSEEMKESNGSMNGTIKSSQSG